jgi:hypothetical protein
MERLKAAEKPGAELIIAILPHVRALVPQESRRGGNERKGSQD